MSVDTAVVHWRTGNPAALTLNNVASSPRRPLTTPLTPSELGQGRKPLTHDYTSSLLRCPSSSSFTRYSPMGNMPTMSMNQHQGTISTVEATHSTKNKATPPNKLHTGPPTDIQDFVLQGLDVSPTPRYSTSSDSKQSTLHVCDPGFTTNALVVPRTHSYNPRNLYTSPLGPQIQTIQQTPVENRHNLLGTGYSEPEYQTYSNTTGSHELSPSTSTHCTSNIGRSKYSGDRFPSIGDYVAFQDLPTPTRCTEPGSTNLHGQSVRGQSSVTYHQQFSMTLVPSDGEEHQGNQQRQLSPTWLDRVGTPTRFLCVSNVPKDISIFAARELFEAFGDLKGIFTTFVATHGIIYIELFDIRNAIEVVRQLQMTIVKGHVLHIRHCSKLEMSSVSRDILENENDGIVLVSMSHPLLKEEELLRLMDRFGNIMSYKNQLNHEATTILVEYYDTRHATAAVVGIQEMNRKGIAQCHAMYARHMQPCDIQESYTERAIPFSRSAALNPISPVSRFGLSMDDETSMDLTLVSSSANALQSRDGADVAATTARLLDSINVSSLCNNLSSCTISKLTSEDSIAPKMKPSQTPSNATASSRAICSSSEDTKDTDRSNKSTTHSTSQSTTPHVQVNTTSAPKSRSSRRARSLSEESNSATPKTPCSSSSLTGSAVTATSIPTTPTSTKGESPGEQADSTSGRSCSLYDLIEGYRGANDKRTTFMIRDIPNKYTQQMLYELISKTHRGKFDFLYLRIDFKNKCNVGYAFINFINVEVVESFAREHVGKRWPCFNSEKKCRLAYADVQGFDKLVEKFRNSAVMEEDPSYRPKFYYTSGPNAGEERPIPEGTANQEHSSRSYGSVKRRHSSKA